MIALYLTIYLVATVAFVLALARAARHPVPSATMAELTTIGWLWRRTMQHEVMIGDL